MQDCGSSPEFRLPRIFWASGSGGRRPGHEGPRQDSLAATSGRSWSGLRAEIKQLQMERDIFKKAAAFFANKKK